MNTWLERTGVRLRGVLQYLDEQGPTASAKNILTSIEQLLPPNEAELEVRSTGDPVWLNDLKWQITNLVKAGWMSKDGQGNWTITELGRAALRDLPDSTAFHTEANRKLQEWRQERDLEGRRRAWVVRGSSVLGVNLVPNWLADGFCSLAGSQLRPIQPDTTGEALDQVAREDYSHLNHHELKTKVDEIVAFVTKMRVGDLVLTTSEQHVYVGDVTGEATYLTSDGGRSNLRRKVEWRNQDAPVDYSELPTPLPARLQTGVTVLDLTTELAVIDALGSPAIDLADPAVAEIEPELKRHEYLRDPSDGLASTLFVDEEWLTEVRDVLDERRQLIFYGPPGTGKTWIARKLAADLVGPEQVKLVQFHPAYTYEDFFEGYRPAPGTASGTISFELKAGPFRQLVNRAREHPDQAFVLIIDEINRANLAKVFGELYFLLEYRDQAVDLLYSSDDEGFTLPTNIYVIGTMNTADRSIALLDAAMRRRFAFVELSPNMEPTRSLLARWSAYHGLDSTAADLLDELNRRIDDPDFRIGPSYFMRSTAPDAHDWERLERTWRTSILPLLQEHHYGEWENAERKYQLKSLLAATAAPSEVAAEDALEQGESDGGSDGEGKE
jgi:5-methylcytosine-specific restriction protein B